MYVWSSTLPGSHAALAIFSSLSPSLSLQEQKQEWMTDLQHYAEVTNEAINNLGHMIKPVVLEDYKNIEKKVLKQ